ncbi:hypothetical protein [Neoroseomonas soli]|uniref:Uncharacterized protein n=1 Tax=Neoroseomonas soli TaxID=1081025 RepID=A0A9X9WZF2_9PROT|nr:hypothetical protein [Neoroseomonas soli]MBR0672531.1 hypothetical protein [Neoroseomonas soli]
MVDSLARTLSFLSGDKAGSVTVESCLLIALVSAALMGVTSILNREVDAMFLDLASRLAALR